jgi:hypothetical protein
MAIHNSTISQTDGPPLPAGFRLCRLSVVLDFQGILTAAGARSHSG